MKPDSIRKFDWLYLGSIAVSLIGVVLGWDAISAQMDAEMSRQGIGLNESLGEAAIFVSVGFGIAIGLALWALVFALRIEFVEWMLVALVVWSVFSSLGVVTAGVFDLNLVLGLVSTIMSLIAVTYLFRPDAKAWFEERRSGDDPA